MTVSKKHFRLNLFFITALVASTFSLSAGAEETSEKTQANNDPATLESEGRTESKTVGFDVGLKVGGTFHTLFNELSPFVTLELEGGLTFLEKRIQLDLSVAWARPPADAEASDNRFETGGYEWNLKQDLLTFAIIARYRFFDPKKIFNLYAGLGPRLYLLRTVANGSAGGQEFGETRQYETRFGGVVVLGPELHLGPGALSIELAFAFGDLDGLITGDTNTSALDVLLGYRLLF